MTTASVTITALAARWTAAGDSAFGAGFIAFVVFLALCVGAFLLFRSMSRHLRKVPDKFDPPSPPPPPPPDEDGQ